MSELEERAQELVKSVQDECYNPDEVDWIAAADLIEQALLAERRLAMTFCAELPLEGKPDYPEENGTAAHLRSEIRRAAAEKEVGK